MDGQALSYRNVCNQGADPYHDGENECLNDKPARRAVDFLAMKREHEGKLARVAMSA
jgi:hypothetical protein